MKEWSASENRLNKCGSKSRKKKEISSIYGIYIIAKNISILIVCFEIRNSFLHLIR